MKVKHITLILSLLLLATQLQAYPLEELKSIESENSKQKSLGASILIGGVQLSSPYYDIKSDNDTKIYKVSKSEIYFTATRDILPDTYTTEESLNTYKSRLESMSTRYPSSSMYDIKISGQEGTCLYISTKTGGAFVIAVPVNNIVHVIKITHNGITTYNEARNLILKLKLTSIPTPISSSLNMKSTSTTLPINKPPSVTINDEITSEDTSKYKYTLYESKLLDTFLKYDDYTLKIPHYLEILPPTENIYKKHIRAQFSEPETGISIIYTLRELNSNEKGYLSKYIEEMRSALSSNLPANQLSTENSTSTLEEQSLISVDIVDILLPTGAIAHKVLYTDSESNFLLEQIYLQDNKRLHIFTGTCKDTKGVETLTKALDYLVDNISKND